MRRAVSGLVFGAIAAFCAASCSRPPATAVVVSFDTDFAVESNDTVEINLLRGDDLGALIPDANLESTPQTLTLYDNPDKDTDIAVPVTVSAVFSHPQLGLKVTRSVRVTYAKEETKLLRLNLELACAKVECPAGTTCIAGACSDDRVDGASLPVYDKAAVENAGAECFKATCLDGEMQLDAASLGITPGGGACTITSPITPGAGGELNVSVGWSFVSGARSVLPRGPGGYELTGQQIKLPAALCEALTSGRATSLGFSASCAPKTAAMPMCAKPKLAAPAQSGKGGSSGAGGTTAKGGSAGKGG